MGAEIREQRVEQIMRIAVAIEIGGEFAWLAFEQFRWRVVLLKIDEHWLPCIVISGCRKAASPESGVTDRDYGSRAPSCARPPMTRLSHNGKFAIAPIGDPHG